MIKKIRTGLILERITLGILGVTLFLRLLIYRFFPTSPEQSMKEVSIAAGRADMIIVSVLLAAAILFLAKLILNKEPFPRTTLDIPLLIFFAAAAASFLYSEERISTATGVISLLVNISVFYALAGCLNSDYRRKLFMVLLIGSGLTAALLGLIHYFFIYGSMPKADLAGFAQHMVDIKRIGSLFGWPNIFAGFLMLVILPSISLVLVLKDRKEKFWAAFVAIVLILAMFLTRSILCWASFMAGIALFGYMLIRMKRGMVKDRKLKLIWVSTAALLAVFFFLIVQKRIDLFTKSSVTARIEYLRILFTIIKTHPFLGSGFNTFGIMSSRLMSVPEGFSMYAHNTYLEIWSGTGLAGFFAFIWMVLAIVKHGFKNIVNIKTPENKILFLGVFCGVFAFLIDNLFNFTLLYPHTSLFWWISLAIIFSWERNGTGKLA